MITRQFGIPVTSPGAILRREKDLGTPLGKKTAEVLQSGGLVSDKIIIELIEDWLRLHGGHGFVFDGFPRTLRQAESLTSILARLRTALDLAIRNRLCAIALPAGCNAANAALLPAHPARSSQNARYALIATVH
jgi:adenylate kinase